nr:undecaprenyl-diphosphate phosphatase [Novipirellula artificiosorum]
MLPIIILAIVQGIAEFLPISSSGHLVILGAMMGELSESPTLEIILHAGTLGSILVVYWKRILDLLTSDRRVIGLLVVGTLPAVIIGLTIKQHFEWILRMPVVVGVALLATGLFLILLGRLKPKDGEYQRMTYLDALMIGCFQAFAILPGVSRSGSTILGGRLLGLRNDDSVTFSFLLAIPAICGATVLAVKDVIEQQGAGVAIQYTPSQMLVGAVVAFVVGIAALKWLIGWSRLDRLHWFAWWCIPMGLIVIFCAQKNLL